MVAKGVLYEIGMLITGHHTMEGYGQYDRIHEIKMTDATLIYANPHMTYKNALSIVSKDFLAKKVVGNAGNLRPLIAMLSPAGREKGPLVCSICKNIKFKMKLSPIKFWLDVLNYKILIIF